MDMNYRGGIGRKGVGRIEWSEGGDWDNCNSIINKYIKKFLNTTKNNNNNNNLKKKVGKMAGREGGVESTSPQHQ